MMLASIEPTIVQDKAVEWLLTCGEPAVRAMVMSDLLNYSEDNPLLQAERARFFEGPWVKALLEGQKADGSFGVHPYQKWTGAHWRLVSLVELGVAEGEPRALAAAEGLLGWLTGVSHRQRIIKLEGRTRRCASQEGNALAVCSRLGLSHDERVELLARSLVKWQWPDGGWNCDKDPQANHSSFYESISPLGGLIEYHRATNDPDALAASHRAAEFFLSHRLFRSDRTGDIINPRWLKLHYPVYWHFDILQGLLILSRLGPLEDPRLADALQLIISSRQGNGCWRAGEYYWVMAGKRSSNIDIVEWGRGGSNIMITLNALRVLKSAGRLISTQGV